MQATIRIKGYDGIEQLALGKRTAVYKVRKSRFKKPVVVKVLLPHLMGERRFLERFEKSARLAAGISHENIVNVLEYGRFENSLYLTVEQYEGNPLPEILAEHPHVPVDVALSIVLQVSHALEAAHAVGLVHRDVRPANIIVTDDGVAKLANFALATDIGENGRVTHAGKVTATPAYMSPEQTRGETLSAQSDIFSLGSVAFELLTGRRAFGSGDFGQIVERVRSSVVPAMGSINPLVESPFERILSGMLHKDPSQRYEHVSELLMDLEEAMDKHGYRAERSELAAFAADPRAFFEEYARRAVERLVARAPLRDGAASAAARLRYYQKLVYLDPADEGAKQELARLQRGPATSSRRSGGPVPSDAPDLDAVSAMSGARYADLDPNATYRVVLESIDTNRDNEASFSLKLSMKLRAPLPRVKSIVNKMPARVADRLAYRRALRLAKMIEGLGGRVRLDVCPADKSTRSPVAGQPAPATLREGRTCPDCGWVDDQDAEFCSVCLRSFTKSRRIDLRALRDAQPVDNPLADSSVRSNFVKNYLSTGLGALAALPPRAKIVGLAAVIVVVILVAVTR